MKQPRRERTFAHQPGYPQIVSSGPEMSLVCPLLFSSPHDALLSFSNLIVLPVIHTLTSGQTKAYDLSQSQRQPESWQEEGNGALLGLCSSLPTDALPALWLAAESTLFTDLE